jgi:hypothetical protein
MRSLPSTQGVSAIGRRTAGLPAARCCIAPRSPAKLNSAASEGALRPARTQARSPGYSANESSQSKAHQVEREVRLAGHRPQPDEFTGAQHVAKLQL